jgi:hypothetical protein
MVGGLLQAPVCQFADWHKARASSTLVLPSLLLFNNAPLFLEFHYLTLKVITYVV